MIFDRTLASVRRGSPVAYAVAAVLSAAATLPARAQTSEGLEEVIVTAQRRETSLQTTPVAISAYTGEKLAEDKIFTVGDLANSVPAPLASTSLACRAMLRPADGVLMATLPR